MAEPVKYLKIVSDLFHLYQKELIRLFKKCNSGFLQCRSSRTTTIIRENIRHDPRQNERS
jgi:hypothetical protein